MIARGLTRVMVKGLARQGDGQGVGLGDGQVVGYGCLVTVISLLS